MKPKVKTQKNPYGFQQNPKKSQTLKCSVKGYQDCAFKVEKGEIFTAVKKIGDYGRAFKIVGLERGPLGQL